jgi:hypothetical protein
MTKFEESVIKILEEFKKSEPNKKVILDNINNLILEYISLGENFIKVSDKYEDLLKRNTDFIDNWLKSRP